MRRADREITDFDELIAVMRGCDVCRLALHDEPYPYILPLNFGLEADGGTVRLYFHGADTGTKYDLIARNPNASFEMDRGHGLILAVLRRSDIDATKGVVRNIVCLFGRTDCLLDPIDIKWLCAGR